MRASIKSSSREAVAPPEPVVVGTGLVALDLVISYLQPRQSRHFAGGTCGNVLTVLSYLGWKSYPVTRLRPNSAAEEIRSDMAKWGVHLEFVARRRTGSTPIIVHRIERGFDGRPMHRFTWNCPDCGSMLPTYKPILAEDARNLASAIPLPVVFFMDRVSRGALILAREYALRGAVVVFEPSGIGDPRLFGEAIKIAHIIKHSHDRMMNLDSGTPREEPLLEVETLGDQGLRYRAQMDHIDTTSWRHLTAFPVQNFRDGAGAGDWCTAGLLNCLATTGLKGFGNTTASDLRYALRYGQALAARNCEFEGARGAMYLATREEFRAAIERMMTGTHVHQMTQVKDTEGSPRRVCPECRRRNRRSIEPHTRQHKSTKGDTGMTTDA